MISYRVENIEDSIFIVRENENGTFSWIPSDPNNSDYQEYLNQASQSISDVTE